MIASARNSPEEAKIQDELFPSCRHSPAVRTFLTNLFSEVYEVLSPYSARSETSEVLLWLC